MIFARRLASRDDRGETSEDYEGVRVPRAPKIATPFDDSSPAYRRRTIKLRAIRILRDNGFTAADAAIAVDLSERHVKRCSATLREMAEAMGRV